MMPIMIDDCGRNGEWNFHHYITDTSDFEYQIAEGLTRIHVSKVGGGTVGQEYSGAWYWALSFLGEVKDHGVTDMPWPKTHRQISAIVATFLLADWGIEA